METDIRVAPHPENRSKPPLFARPRTGRDLTPAEWDRAIRLTGVVVMGPDE